MKRYLWLGTVAVLFVICLGCGDTFRPIIIPNPPQFPNPKASHSVLTVSDNGTVVPGSAMSIDVSGDTDVSIKNVGLAPVHAVQQTASQVIVANQSITGAQADSISKLIFSGTVMQTVDTISLPFNSAPNFVATTESSQVYVSMPGAAPPSVAVVSTVTDAIVATIPVGNKPYAIAETPDTKKLYVANNGDGTVDAFNTLDRSSRGINGAFNAPLWISTRSDSQRVYVLNGNGVISTLDTSGSAGPDTVIDSSISVPGATIMVYDVILNRLYVPGGGKVTILNVGGSVPQVLGGGPITIPTVAPGTRSAGDPCALTGTGPLNVVAAAALPDASRAYVGSWYSDGAGNICPQVTVIDASSSTIKTSVPVPGFPDATIPSTPYYVPICATTRFRMMMAAAGDSSRAYLSSCDGGNVNIIDTGTDTYFLNVPAPLSARPPIPPNTQNPPQNPVFMIAGP